MVPTMAATISTARRTTASFSEAKKCATGCRSHAGRELEVELAMQTGAIFREELLAFNSQCTATAISRAQNQAGRGQILARGRVAQRATATADGIVGGRV